MKYETKIKKLGEDFWISLPTKLLKSSKDIVGKKFKVIVLLFENGKKAPSET